VVRCSCSRGSNASRNPAQLLLFAFAAFSKAGAHSGALRYPPSSQSAGQRRRFRVTERSGKQLIMNVLSTALLCSASFLAGFVDAIAGGGGLISVPSLLSTGLSVPMTLGTNKGQAIFGAATSLATYYRKGGLDRARILPSFVAAFLGSLIGARLLLSLPAAPLKPVVLVLLILALLAVLWPKPAEKQPSSSPPSAGADEVHAINFTTGTTAQLRAKSPWWLAAVALLLGSYDGFFGPGTGSILIAIYMRLFGDSAMRASGNAKVANFASNLAAVCIFAYRGNILWHTALPMAAANALGAMLGARAALAVGAKLVRFVLVSVVLVLIGKVGWELLPLIRRS
jgi:uncharacterized protein